MVEFGAWSEYARLPKDIGKLDKFDELNAEYVHLKDLTGIGQLRKLRKLNLHLNEFATLPDEFGQLTQLEWLNLDSNDHLKVVPEIIFKLRKLKGDVPSVVEKRWRVQRSYATSSS